MRRKLFCSVTFVLVFGLVSSAAPFMYWSDNFPDITVLEHITERDDVVSGSSTTTSFGT